MQKTNSKGTTLFFGIDVGGARWRVAMADGIGRSPRVRGVDADDVMGILEELSKAKARFGLSENAQCVGCYEAGWSGFWLQRELEDLGIPTFIIDPSSVLVDRRAKQRKTDAIDASKLVQTLIRYHKGDDVCRIVRVPSVCEEDERQRHREIERLQKELNSACSRAHSLLARHGINLKRFQLKHLRELLGDLTLRDGSATPPVMNDELERLGARIELVRTQLCEARKDRLSALQDNHVWAEKVDTLHALRAIGVQAAWVLVAEFFGWRTFNNRQEVAAAAGLTGTPFDTGGRHREQGISKAGNRRVRSLMVEIAWAWLRFQPNSKLTRWFEDRYARGGPRSRKAGIVALARKLLVALWRFVETGEVPAGAELKRLPS